MIDHDELTADVLSEISTTKYYNEALDAGCKVLIVDKFNNLVEVSPDRTEKILMELSHKDCNIDDLKKNFKNDKYLIK